MTAIELIEKLINELNRVGEDMEVLFNESGSKAWVEACEVETLLAGDAPFISIKTKIV